MPEFKTAEERADLLMSWYESHTTIQEKIADALRTIPVEPIP